MRGVKTELLDVHSVKAKPFETSVNATQSSIQSHRKLSAFVPTPLTQLWWGTFSRNN
jgi:hypothetical protein